MIRSGQRALRACWLRVASRAARSYVAGPELSDAIETCRLAANNGFSSSIAFWNGDRMRPAQVAEAYGRALDALRMEILDCYLSVKAPPLGFDASLISDLADRAGSNGIGIHFDSLGPDAADATFALIRGEVGRHPGLGCTLPGRWRRSLEDAGVAIDLGLRVRVVKGQWPDPEHGEVDPAEGFLSLIDRLAGRIPRVAIATHDPVLLEEALRRLKESKTSCEVELLFGLPLRRAVLVAEEYGAPLRVYVPYGLAWLPYSLSRAVRNPRILLWILRDSFARASGLERAPRMVPRPVPVRPGQTGV